ncbi:MAG: agmatine deiminase family protein [Bacteroidaceae bacterium]|nr:agmatine deiminase family protein [Bacteroidaceae bacterium]
MALHYTPSTPTISDLTLHLTIPDLPRQEETHLRSTFFPAEWHPQSGVQLTWPHANTDWADLLPEVDNCFVHIAFEILNHDERLLIVTPEPDRIQTLLAERLPARLLPAVCYFECPTNDTWARDHAFLTLISPDGPLLLDFQFNGWGKKFPADLDNQICRRMANEINEVNGADGANGANGSSLLRGIYEPHLDFVFEGGSIESDGCGTLMTTSECLLSPHRNPGLTREQIEQRLLHYFHAERVLWLDHGYLAGDDTDSHIDTLARFCPGGTIAYIQCTDPADEHYESLRAMEEQLRTFCVLGASPDEDASYQPIPLPLPSPIFDPDDGHRLPATYANFLILNSAVLLPTYGQPANDDLARSQLQRAFPRHEIVPVDCRVLIRQHGSLHCSTMQFPVGVMEVKKAK